MRDSPVSEDHWVATAKQALSLFFARRRTPFHIGQLEILFEKKFFHWVTNKAIHELNTQGSLAITPYFTALPLSLRFVHSPQPHRALLETHIRSKAKMIEAYSNPEVTDGLGKHLQALVKAELRANGLNIVSENSAEFKGRAWTLTGHDLDFIAETSQGIGIGVEVKNTLPYIPEQELDIKLQMCEFLHIHPLFVLRTFPAHWWYKYNIKDRGAFVLMLEYQLFPLGYKTTVDRLKKRMSVRQIPQTIGVILKRQALQKTIETLEWPVLVATELPLPAQRLLANWLQQL